MRVLLTTDTIGGVWTFTRELSEGLLGAGHEVALVSFGRAASPEQSGWAGRTLDEFGSRFEYWSSSDPLEWMQENDHTLVAASEMLQRHAARFSPDLLHSNQYCFGSLPVEIPKLITAHSDVLSWAAACHPQGLEPTPWLNRYCALVQAGLDGADTVVAPTTHALDTLSSHFDVRCRTSVTANGRTLAPREAASFRRRQAASVGRLWDEAKGLRTLFETDSPVPIFVAGEESFEGASISRTCMQVQPLGILTEDALLDLFHQSSVYLVTSLYEPFGLAPLEAALEGCAIVARDLPSLREVWGDAAVYFNTAIQLSERLHTLFASESRLQAAQSASQCRAESFTAQKMVSCYIRLYEDLIADTEPHSNVQECESHAA